MLNGEGSWAATLYRIALYKWMLLSNGARLRLGGGRAHRYEK